MSRWWTAKHFTSWLTLAPGKPFQLIASDELFLNLSESDFRTEPGFDQNRAFLGVGYQATPDLRVELGYMNHYVHRYTDADQVNHVFATNVHVRFGFPPPSPPPAQQAPTTNEPAPVSESAPVSEPAHVSEPVEAPLATP